MARPVDALDLPPRNLPAPPQYRQPVLITTYSHLADRSIEPGDASMAWYRGAPAGADLRYGLERRIERDESVDEHLDGLVDSLRRAIEERGAAERPGGVVTWRGMLTRILTAPYEERDGWEMDALALGGSVYLELYDPPEARAARAKDQARWADASYMGYAYESWSTVGGEAGGDGGPEDWGGDVNTNVQVRDVVRSAVGDVPVCLGGEVDCVMGQPGTPNPGLSSTVELKTNKVIESERHDAVFHKKLLKHWAQSFLLGVETVEVGFRTDAGILVSRHAFPTGAIPGIAAAAHNAWSPVPCLHFLHAVLAMLVRHVLPTDPAASAQDYNERDPLPPATLFRLRFTPRGGCELFNLGEVGADGGRWGGILPEDYVRWRLARPT
ncbi:decapping endonuclease targeting mRNA [Vanrija albida]|uniref:Decapping nuclease n=1 Tax=Vanrija albida TaxID=181172 RepID=A0ABR3PYT9_9TREE